MSMKIQLGQIVQTSGVVGTFTDPKFPLECLTRHASGDWGDLCDEDKHTNDRAIMRGGRLLSCYKSEKGPLWIITEADRSATTLLLPSEY